MRQIQERQIYPNGIKTEWEPAQGLAGRLRPTNERDAREAVTELNREAKKNGDWTRYRSISEESE